MKKYSILWSILLCIFFNKNIHAGFWDSTADSLSGSFSFIKQFGMGMAQAFGMNPPGFNTNIRVFNNSEGFIEVVLDKMKKYQGVTFHEGTIKTSGGILPGQDTGSDLLDIDLYLRVVLRASTDGGSSYDEIFSDMVVSEEPQYHHCKDTYVYNIYTNQHGPQAEYLGYNKSTTTEFYGQIYNGLTEPCYLRYTYNKEVFSVILEPDTFNFLQSDPKVSDSMRPGTLLFTFSDGSTQQVTSPKEGIANSFSQTTSSGVATKLSSPMQYHYEIYNNAQGKPHVYCVGLGMGNYKNPANGDIRLVGPVTCSIWNKSADQVQQYPDYMSVQSTDRTVWFAYGAPGWANITSGIKNIIIDTIPYGQAVSFKFIRPTVMPYKAILDNGTSFITQKLSSRDILAIPNLDVDPSKANFLSGYFSRKDRIQGWLGDYTAPLNKDEQNEKDLLGYVLEPVNLYTYMHAISETTAKGLLYIVSLNTADKVKARTFMQKLVTGQLQYNYQEHDSVIQTLEKDITDVKAHNKVSANSQSFLMSGDLKTDYGVIHDPETGVEGHLLIMDIFLPYGNGLGTYYYTVEPPIQSVSIAKLSWLKTYLKKDYFSDPTNEAAFSTILQQWVQKIYQSDTVDQGLQTVYPDILSFLQSNGNDSLFNRDTQGKVNTNKLSALGNYVLTTMIAGPGSVLNSPLYWPSGVSSYVISGTAVPTQFDSKTNTLVSGWKPTKTNILNIPSPNFIQTTDDKLGLGVPYSYVSTQSSVQKQ